MQKLIKSLPIHALSYRDVLHARLLKSPRSPIAIESWGRASECGCNAS